MSYQIVRRQAKERELGSAEFESRAHVELEALRMSAPIGNRDNFYEIVDLDTGSVVAIVYNGQTYIRASR